MKRARTTSAECYRVIQPTLQRREQIVMDALSSWQGAPPTSYELTEHLKALGLAFDLNSIRPRLTSLQQKHLVITAEKRQCRISGKRALTWCLSTPKPLSLSEPIAQELPL